MKKILEDFLKSKISRISILLIALTAVGFYVDSHITQDLEMMRRIVSLEEGLLKQLKYISMLEKQSSQSIAEIRRLREFEKEIKSSSGSAQNIIISSINPRILRALLKPQQKINIKSCKAVQKNLTCLQRLVEKAHKKQVYSKYEERYLLKVIASEKTYFLKLCSK